MFKQIREDFKEIKEYINQTITTITSTIKIRLLIYMADLMQKTYNKRFFVTIICTPQGERLKIINNDMFKMYKRRGWMRKTMPEIELADKCFYATPLSKNNNIPKEERKKATEKYVSYTKMIRMGQRSRLKRVN